MIHGGNQYPQNSSHVSKMQYLDIGLAVEEKDEMRGCCLAVGYGKEAADGKTTWSKLAALENDSHAIAATFSQVWNGRVFVDVCT